MITKNIVVGGFGYAAYQALRGVPFKLIDLSRAPFELHSGWSGVDIKFIDNSGWENFAINTRADSILWYPPSSNINYNGQYLGCYNNRAITIIVRPQDSIEDLTLRVWHELLHYHGQPADYMDDWIAVCVGEWDLFVYPIVKYFRKNYYERKFYEYLTGRV